MNICSAGHEEIVYIKRECTACSLLAQIEDLENKLKKFKQIQLNYGVSVLNGLMTARMLRPRLEETITSYGQEMTKKAWLSTGESNGWAKDMKIIS